MLRATAQMPCAVKYVALEAATSRRNKLLRTRSSGKQLTTNARENGAMARRRALFRLRHRDHQPRQLVREICLDVADIHVEHAIVAALQPEPPRGAIGDNRL